MTLAAAGALAFGGYAKAANVGVTPTKLIVVDKGASGAKAVFVAKDGLIDKGTGTDTSTISVTFDFEYDNGVDPSTAGQFVAAEGSANWLVNKTTVAKYVNKTAPTGGGAKVVVIKPANLVKLVGKNLGDTPIDILSQSGAATGTAFTQYNISDSSTGFDTSFCSTLSGCAWKSIAGGTGAKLVCKGGAPNGACSGPTPPAPFLSFVTGTPGGTCGTVNNGGVGGTQLKVLTCGGLNTGAGSGATSVPEGPTPGGSETQFNVAGGPVFTLSARTSAESGSSNNCSDTGCKFGTWLPIAGTLSTCVQITFASPGSGTLNSATGDFTGNVNLSSAVYLTNNSVQPCTPCIGGTVGVANSGTCDPAWHDSSNVQSPNQGQACTPRDTGGHNYDCAPPGAPTGTIPVNLSPLTTGVATKSETSPGGGGAGSKHFCPSQTVNGAFGQTLADYIEEDGDANPVGAGAAPTILASVFCIPATGNGGIDVIAGLPGPGATSLPGTLDLLP
jgi:hypothetical protein